MVGEFGCGARRRASGARRGARLDWTGCRIRAAMSKAGHVGR
jgi:hypothetical protein